jgi:HK97 gp10 family phage protein
MTATIIGLPEAMAKIAAIPEVAEVSGEASLAAGKAELSTAMRALAPKRTGLLAGSIVAVPEGIAVVARYAGYVEFGTVNMAAIPFVEPVMEHLGPVVGEQVTKTVRTALYAL